MITAACRPARDAEEAWRLDGAEQRGRAEACEGGTVEAWGRSEKNPVGGWYGLRRGCAAVSACIFRH